jgi:hypothetical protein
LLIILHYQVKYQHLHSLTTAVGDQLQTNITFIEDKATEQHKYTVIIHLNTDQEVEVLRNEEYIPKAVTEI